MHKDLSQGVGFKSADLVTTPSYAILTGRVLTVLFPLIIISMFLVPWQQTSVGTGRVIAFSPVEREQVIKAPIPGTIAKWHVHEGQPVKKGGLILEMADNDPELMGRLQVEQNSAVAKLNATKINVDSMNQQLDALANLKELTNAQANALIVTAANKIKAAKQKIEAGEAKLAAANFNLERRRELLEKGLSSRRDYELAERSQKEAKAEYYKLKAELSGSRSELIGKKAERAKKLADVDAKIAKENASLQKSVGDNASASALLAKAETKVSRQKQMSIRAPRDGVLTKMLVREGGEYLKAGDSIAVFVPDMSEQAVEIWVDGNDVPLVTPGRSVRVQFEGWPAVQFSGWPSVAVGTFPGLVKFVDARADTDGRFRVVVVPEESDWPENKFLRQGARANGWILLNNVTVGYEIWRKLNGFPPQLDKKASNAAIQPK